MNSATNGRNKMEKEDFNKELCDFFEKTPNIIKDDLRFKYKLQISEDAYRNLKKTKVLKDILEVSIGAAGGGLGYAAFHYSSLGIFGKLALGVSMTAFPLTGVLVAGGVTALGILSFKNFLRTLEKKAIDKIPKFLNTPLDLIALGIVNIFMPPALRICHADGMSHHTEIQYIKNYFSEQWGYDDRFISEFLNLVESDLDRFDYKSYSERVRTILGAFREISHSKTMEELIYFLEQIIKIQKTAGPTQKLEYNKLKSAIRGSLTDTGRKRILKIKNH